MNKSAIVGISLLCVALAGGAGFWFGEHRAKAPADAATAAPAKGTASGALMTVEATKVTRQALPQMITAVGSLRSDESVTLRPEVAGRVDAILFKEGQNVSKGMTLVRLDPAINKAEVQQAKANLVLAKSKYDRAVELSQRNFISGQAKDEAENNLRVAESAVALVEARLAKTEIKAPAGGAINYLMNYSQGWMNAKPFKVGDNVYAGMEIAEMPDLGTLTMDAKVEEIDRGRIEPGQETRVRIDSLPELTMNAKLDRISLMAETTNEFPPTRNFRAYAPIVKPDGRLRPGMNGGMDIVIRRIPNAISIPSKALFTHAGKPVVYVAEKGQYRAVNVDVQARNPDEVAVTGIPAGTMVTVVDIEKKDQKK